MATQTTNGKAFEWSVASAASEQTGAAITMGSAAETALRCFEALKPSKQSEMSVAASKAVSHLLRVDARKRPGGFTSIDLALDAEGQAGDVRDVLLKSQDRVVGISCKNNNADFKHSRLSGDLDFIKKWGVNADGCRPEYWSSVGPLFASLATIRKESSARALWEDIPDKATQFYWPILDAWEQEIRAACATSSEGAQGLFRYIVGSHDFYKVVNMKESVYVQAFNFGKSLGAPASGVPTVVVGVDRSNGNQYSKTVRFDKGYVFNFRIHNASSRVEPSLKFAVTAIGLPAQHIYTNHILLDM